MLITIAICTWNRADLLGHTLASLRDMHVPDGLEWEVLVVNNRCTDNTDAVVSSFSASLPVRLVHESVQGHSAARNRALLEARGEWIVFTDDDVLVDPSFLEAYATAIRTYGQEVAFMGGPIDPWFPVAPDPAMAAAIPTVARGFCGLDVEADGYIRDRTGGTPLGANMAFARRCLTTLHFDQNLGVKGTERITGEEVLLMCQLLTAGHIGYWVKRARVRHYVAPHRLTLPYLRKHFYDLGRADVRVNGIPPGIWFFGPPAWLWKDVASSAMKTMWCWARGNRFHFYQTYARFFIRAGMLRESLIHKQRKGQQMATRAISG